MNNQKIRYWVIPPEENAEFVANMENVLDVYKRPYNSEIPVICMDEKPIQLLGDAKESIPETQTHPKLVDYQYIRKGTACIFLFTETLAGWRDIKVKERRTKVDWAVEIAELIETRYFNAKKVIIVCDNLNTHTKGAFYQAFPPEKARVFAEKIEFCFTPKHGSWLNIAENELSSMSKQSLNGLKFANIKDLQFHLSKWTEQANSSHKSVDWHFSTQDARIKLKSLYPKI